MGGKYTRSNNNKRTPCQPIRMVMSRKKTFIYFEIVVGYLVIDCLNYLFFKSDPGFLHARLHPYWIVIALVSSAYGLIPGTVAGAIGSIHVLAVLFHGIPDKVALEKMLETSGLVLPVGFFLAGLLLGELRQKHLNQEEELKAQIKENEKTLKTIKDNLKTQEKMRIALESRIVGQTTTVKTLYETAKKLETFDLENVYAGCLEMLSTHLQVEKASLYILEGAYFTLKAARGWGKDEMVEGKIGRASCRERV